MRIARLLITTNILVLMLLLIVLFGGTQPQVAQATGTTQITACKAKSGGALRVASTCKSSETRLVWNVQGSQGIQGIPGTNATVETQTVTFKYLSSRGGSIGCSPGTQTFSNTGNVGYIFPWYFSASQEQSSELSYARNWKPIYECQITLKVVK